MSAQALTRAELRILSESVARLGLGRASAYYGVEPGPFVAALGGRPLDRLDRAVMKNRLRESALPWATR